MEQKFRKFWVKTVNNWITDAGYNGKALKEANPFPSFRKFYFIRSWEDLKGFSVHSNYPDNRILCEKLLLNSENPTQP